MSQRPPISPRSPRAALEPEQVPRPPLRSQRARNPLVMIGNAIMTLLIISMIVVGAVFFYGKQIIEAKGPLTEDKIVNIPPRAGMLAAAGGRNRAADACKCRARQRSARETQATLAEVSDRAAAGGVRAQLDARRNGRAG